jgi:hypothetical protein
MDPTAEFIEKWTNFCNHLLEFSSLSETVRARTEALRDGADKVFLVFAFAAAQHRIDTEALNSDITNRDIDAVAADLDTGSATFQDYFGALRECPDVLADDRFWKYIQFFAWFAENFF